MLRQIEIQNFRSLRDVRVAFGGTGLTVIVGANGTGKSNLIKCLEFLGAIPRDGLEDTVRAANGADAILPKAMSPRDLRQAEVRFKYDVELARPVGYPSHAPPLLITHELALRLKGMSSFRVVREKLRFSEPLRVEAVLNGDSERPRARSLEDIPTSSLILQRNEDSQVSVVANPSISGRYLTEYLRWFGLSFLESSFTNKTPEEIGGTLASFFSRITGAAAVDGAPADRLTSLIDGNAPSMLTFSRQAKGFMLFMESIKRFDLQLSQLRRQQDIAAQRHLTPDGRGLPAAVRNLKGTSGVHGNWRRVAATLEELAPHIVDTRISQLKSGQEFVQFVEERSGRPVESWQSSDGTLRALAILLAIETHPAASAILIEEPEQGLHPWAIRTLITHIREVIAERRLQVVVTTHSQQVLDCVSPQEVLVASRGPGIGTKFQTIEEVIGKHAIEQGEVGKLWVSGLLGGVPVYE